MKIITADYHRNGVGGEPFYVAIVENAGGDWPKRCLVHRAQGDGRWAEEEGPQVWGEPKNKMRRIAGDLRAIVVGEV